MHTKARRRPRRLIAVTLVLGAIGVVEVAQALRTAQNADLYRALGVSFPVHADAALSLSWGLAFLAVSWGVWRRRTWARRAVFILLPAFGVFSVVWLALYARSDYDVGRLPFLALVTAGGVLLILWTLTQRGVRAAFQPPNDGGHNG